MALQLRSPAFASGQPIPSRYTCDGADLSPPLAWSGVPQQTRSLALIVEDPDAPDPAAPTRTWIHWILYDIPADASGLPEGVSRTALPAGTLEGLNDWHRTGYGGPCPPIGWHRYFHRLYALRSMLPDLGRPAKSALLQAMQGHILAETSLMGLYERGGPQR